MRLIWAVIILALISTIEFQESFAKDTDLDYRLLLTDIEGNSSSPQYIGDEHFIALHSTTSFNNQGNPIEAKIRIVCGPNNIELYNETKLFSISDPRTLIDSFTPTFSGVYTMTMTAKEIPQISTVFSLSGNYDDHCDPESIKKLPPLKQIPAGISYENVICKEGLSLIIKNGGYPACVKPETKAKLIERGWAGTTPHIQPTDEKTTQTTKTSVSVNLDRDTYPIPFGTPLDFISKIYENSTTPNGRSIFPIHLTGMGGVGIVNNTLGIDSGEFISSGDLMIHVQITNSDLNSFSDKIDSISDDVDEDGFPVGPVKISIVRNSDDVVVLGYAGGSAISKNGLIDVGDNNPEKARQLGPIYETTDNSGIFAFELTIRYTDGPAHEKCPRTIVYSGLTDVNLDGNLNDQEDRFDEPSRNPYCIMKGDILKIEYAYTTDSSGHTNIVADTATFDLKNGVIESDSDVYLIGSDMVFTLIEYDLNLDSQRIEEYDLDLIEWDSNAATITIGNADGQISLFDPEPTIFRETGKDTGIFEVKVVMPSELADESLGRGEEIVLEYTDWSPSGADFVGQEDEDINLIIYSSNFGATVKLDKEKYALGDTVHITIVSPNHNLNSDLPEEIGDTAPYTVKITTSKFTLDNYKLFETGNDTGIFAGKVTLFGSGTGQTTQGSGPTDGMIEANNNDNVIISFEFSEDETIVGSALISEK